jgi:hypothetical protein
MSITTDDLQRIGPAADVDAVAWRARDVRDELIDRTRNLLERLERGCWDHNCKMRKHLGGIGTNGGCRCWRGMADDYIECATLVESIPNNKHVP